MPILSKPSSAARLAIVYITLGALTDVWSAIWYVYLNNHRDQLIDTNAWYWCYGFLLTGLTLIVIGLALGRIGRSARHAELPPEEVTAAAARAEQNAAARAPMMAPVNPAVPAQQLANGQVVSTAPVSTAPPVAPTRRLL